MVKLTYEELERDIKKAYETSVTIEEAERMAAKFLGAMFELGLGIRNSDLSARMRKAGVKAIRAAVYLDEAKKGDKKPTEATLTALVDSDKIVGDEQAAFDSAEVEKNLLQNYYDICREAHVYFRGVAKGRFE